MDEELKIDFAFACRDDCLERMVPSDLRALVRERDDLRAHLNSQGGEAVEVVAYRVSLPSEPELGHWLDEHAESDPQMCNHEQLMTVAQHNRIMAAATPPDSRVVPVELLERAAKHLSEGRVDGPAAHELHALLEVKP